MESCNKRALTNTLTLFLSSFQCPRLFFLDSICSRIQLRDFLNVTPTLTHTHTQTHRHTLWTSNQALRHIHTYDGVCMHVYHIESNTPWHRATHTHTHTNTYPCIYIRSAWAASRPYSLILDKITTNIYVFTKNRILCLELRNLDSFIYYMNPMNSNHERKYTKFKHKPRLLSINKRLKMTQDTICYYCLNLMKQRFRLTCASVLMWVEGFNARALQVLVAPLGNDKCMVDVSRIRHRRHVI